MARLSISLTDSLAKFVDQYGKTHGLKRSKVFEEAVKLLRNRELEGAYTESGSELAKTWESTIADGLAHETW